MNDNTTQDRLREILWECAEGVALGDGEEDTKEALDKALAAINAEFDKAQGDVLDEYDEGHVNQVAVGRNEKRIQARQAWYGTTNPNGDNNV